MIPNRCRMITSRIKSVLVDVWKKVVVSLRGLCEEKWESLSHRRESEYPQHQANFETPLANFKKRGCIPKGRRAERRF